MSDMPRITPDDPMTFLRRQAMDADAVAEAALYDASTAEGFWTASLARNIAFDIASRLARVEAENARSNIQLLREAAELDLRKAEAEAKRAEVQFQQERHSQEMVKLAWESQKIMAEVKNLEKAD